MIERVVVKVRLLLRLGVGSGGLLRPGKREPYCAALCTVFEEEKETETTIRCKLMFFS